MRTVILANGEFPKGKEAINILNNAEKIICCDGATENLINYGLKPSIIIGDMDSLSKEIKAKYADIIIKISEQNTNDLTKAVNWCTSNNINTFNILGATGKREDHSIANIALLSEYSNKANVKIISDYGIFKAVSKTSTFNSYIGQQVSIFAMDANTKINSEGLKYPLNNMEFKKWWNGTLNESINETFTLSFEKGSIIVYQLF